jgi:hypothetical protein
MFHALGGIIKNLFKGLIRFGIGVLVPFAVIKNYRMALKLFKKLERRGLQGEIWSAREDDRMIMVFFFTGL